MLENIQVSRLDDGLVILTDKMPGVRSVTLGFFLRAGARHEPAELTGITHFIEHCVFKGTAKRSALDIAIEQDRLGGNLDAFTTHEETGFVIKVIDEQLPQAFDLISDMLINPLFEQHELESEQRVIIEEMKMTEDSPEDYLGEIFSEAFFAAHPLGRPIAGTPQSVKSFGHKKTRDYHNQIYTPANFIIAAAGNVEHSALVELASRFDFRSRQSGQQELDLNVTTPAFAAPVIIRQNENLEQAHLILAVPFVSARDDRRYAADLLANIIGGGTSSRLWQKVREERGLAYSVGASAVMFHDCGYFSVFAGTSPDQIGEVVDISMAEMRDAAANGFSNNELELAKQQVRASILLSLEDSAARAASLAQAEITHGRQIPVEETLTKIDAVSVDDMHKLAIEFFKTENVAFAALGHLKDIEYNNLTRA